MNWNCYWTSLMSCLTKVKNLMSYWNCYYCWKINYYLMMMTMSYYWKQKNSNLMMMNLN